MKKSCEYCQNRTSYVEYDEIPNGRTTARMHPHDNNVLVEYYAHRDGEMFTRISLQFPVKFCPWCGRKL